MRAPAGSRLMAAASTSFVGAMHVTALISVLIAAIGAIAVWIWTPGRAAAGPASVRGESGPGATKAVAATGAADG